MSYRASYAPIPQAFARGQAMPTKSTAMFIPHVLQNNLYGIQRAFFYGF
jgi:hypothetical protein